MLIRAYEPKDFDAVLALVTDVLIEFGFGANVGNAKIDLENIDVGYAGTRAGFWVAIVDNELAGTIAIRSKHDKTCELKRLYVNPKLRGQGIGRALYAHVEAFARNAGYGVIWLDSSRRFKSAHKLYEKNGFVLIEELDNDWEDNVYEKVLTTT